MTDQTLNPSVFETRKLKDIYQEIQAVYLSDQRPWVIGYSGGKDSTTALQLIFYALSQLPSDKRHKPIHVISTDTLVETPLIIDFIDNTHKRLSAKAKEDNLPFVAHRLTPLIADSFWVNLIGKGYPAPSQRFRWCTERLKIRPANKFITEQLSKYGEVVLILGVRRQESATRAQVVSLYEIPNSVLSRHSTFSGAFVYTPIKEWSIDDVWSYLLQVPSPWGNDNRDLVALYRTADGECPLVVDDTTPTCGNSRFGCWVCTLVTEDKSLKALMDSGETWLMPLLKIHDFLVQTQTPENKCLYREHKRKDGKIWLKTNGSGISRGPYKFETRKRILTMVLEAQKEVNTKKPELKLQLILPEELSEIRRLWKVNESDWEDSLPKIYRETMGSDLDWVRDDINFSITEKNLLSDIAAKHNVPPAVPMRLMDIALQSKGMSKRAAIYKKINRILSEDWRSEEEFLNDLEKEKTTGVQ
ncbi:MAG: DNA phosphorothioation system sulfurtransferase DndC [Candidatus Bathyarchaeota archaeon]|nr:DNA phosphorothioation system sulfurtransferase DndC [Candidatus Termiticorpusculum sp.]